MCSYPKNIEYNKGLSFILILAVILLTNMQPGFVTLVYSGINEKDLEIKIENHKATDNSNIVAELNGTAISTQDLSKRYYLFSLMSGASLNIKDRLSVNFYLESYFTELLLLQEAKKMEITVSNDEIEQEKTKYFKSKAISEEEFLKNLSSESLTMEDVDRYFKNNLTILKFGKKKYGDIDISDEEAKNDYDRNINHFIGPEKIAVSHILICHKDSISCRSDLEKQKAKELAENIRKLATPQNFSNLAKQFSTDRTGADGGDLGYITKGSAVPSFEKAAFNLKAGEISDVVETEFGYHIIYVTAKQKARSITFEDAKETIKEKLKEDYIASALFKYSEQILKTADVKMYTQDLSNDIEDIDSKEKALTDLREFKTFKKTGKSINVNSKGQPVIMFFGRIGCSHCQWISETYDSVVREYMEKGLIEAHHYDVETKDDLLTFVRETEIPPDYFKIKDGKEPEFVPYFNFGGIYDRTGTGYEAQDDFFAEEMEMRQVIDYILKMK